MKYFYDQLQLKDMNFLWGFYGESSLYREHNKVKTKCSLMEIGISRVYNVLIVLKLRQSENRQPLLCT